MTYALFAMGNALVDQEYRVEDAFFTTNNIQKGTMQLADASAQSELSKQLNTHAQLGGQVSGGSAANTAFAFASFSKTKHATFYACRVGADPLGDFYLADLQSAHVATATKSKTQGTTGTCLVMVSPDGERTMNTHLGISSELSLDQVDTTAFKQSQLFYIEGYLATSPTARQAVVELRKVAKANQIKTALSLSDPAMVIYARDGLVELLGDGVDYLFCNKDEALQFTAQDNVKSAIEALFTYSPMVIVTLGAEGALIGIRDGLTDQIEKHSFLPVTAASIDQVLDSNGAGDAFAGGFLYGISQKMSLELCGRLAATTAAKVVSQFGPRLAVSDYHDILRHLGK